MTEARNLLTIDETAKYLSLTPETVRRLIRRGELRATKLGKVWRVSREVLRRVENGEAAHSQATTPAASTHDTTPDQTASGNPLARALAMVQERDAATPAPALRVAGTNDAASEIRAMREAQTP